MNKSEETIFCAASQISDAELRALYLKSACGDDLGLRERIDRLIEAEHEADAFWQRTRWTWNGSASLHR